MCNVVLASYETDMTKVVQKEAMRSHTWDSVCKLRARYWIGGVLCAAPQSPTTTPR